MSTVSPKRLLTAEEFYGPPTGDLASPIVVILNPPIKVFLTLQAVQRFHKAGVPLVCIVVPEEGHAVLFPPTGSPRVFDRTDTITGEDLLPGFSCPVAQFFP